MKGGGVSVFNNSITPPPQEAAEEAKLPLTYIIDAVPINAPTGVVAVREGGIKA